MKTTKRISLALAMLFSVLSFGQAMTITGTVIDNKGFLIPGVNIVIKDTKNYVSTDFDGNYTIQAKKGDQLVFSYIDFETASVTVGKSNVINVVLKPSSIKPEEVIIPESVFVRKKEVTAPVVNVSAANLKKTDFKAIKTITGTIFDENGEPLPDANVVVKGTKIATSTDINGKYTIQAKKRDRLVFSHIGYWDDYATVRNSTTINFAMKNRVQTLD